MKNTLHNARLFLSSLILMTFHRIKGWTYPLTHYNEAGFTFNRTSELAELIGYQTINNSKAFQVLKGLPGPVVLVTGITRDHLCINAYTLIPDGGEQDLMRPYQSVAGEVSQFVYIMNNKRLYHALRSTSVTRNMGYLHHDPIFSLQIPLNQTDQRHLEDLLISEPLSLNDVTWSVSHEAGYTRHTVCLEGSVVREQIRPLKGAY